jgi:predicted GH43/DUF377 family glycosyl hydrolase
MKWIKKGLIYCTGGEFGWNKSYTQVPVAYLNKENTIRVFFGSRDATGKSQIGFIELNPKNLKQIIYISKDPVLSYGKLGTFDEAGVVPSSILKLNNELYLYYIGYTVRKTIPYHNSIGLAVSHDDGRSFKKLSEGPIIGSNFYEPYFSASCSVLKENNTFKIWYLSCTKWVIINGLPEAYYNIKYAESENGIQWERRGIVCLDLTLQDDAFAKPFVYKENGIYKMWYSYRSAVNYKTNINMSYRIGYAESTDGIKWERKDNLVGIERSEDGWDSQMIEYCDIVKIEDKKYMFYNGNGFGKTGFGYAVLEE